MSKYQELGTNYMDKRLNNLGKKCVQPVRGQLEKYVHRFPHSPHPTPSSHFRLQTIHRIIHRNTITLHHFFPPFHTDKNQQITDSGFRLSTLSTVPITTIITYI